MIKLPRGIAKPLIGSVIIMLFHGLMSVGHAQPRGNSLPTGVGLSLDMVSIIIQRVIAPILFLIGIIVFQVILKVTSRFPSELDRIGSEINLYGFGILLSLLVLALDSKEPVFPWIEPGNVVLFICVALAATYCSYVVNLSLAERIRRLGRGGLKDGIETLEELSKVLVNPEGRRLMTFSLMLAFFPIAFLLLALALR
jgi:hypothetical protein